MPIQRQKQKADGSKGQGKKHGKHKKILKQTNDESYDEDNHNDTKSKSQLFRPAQQSSQRLINLLRSYPVNRQEIHGFKVTTRVLEQLTSQEVRDLRTVFELFDTNSDGFLSSLDLWHALRTLGFKISKEKAAQMIHDKNFEGRRKISFSEFLEIVIDRQDDARDTYGEIMKGFEWFDLDATGSISIETLRQVCVKAGIKFTQKELKDMMEEADVNGDGFVDRSEFIRIMLQTNLF